MNQQLTPFGVEPGGPEAQVIEVDIRKGTLTMRIKWPASAGADFASWAASILK